MATVEKSVEVHVPVSTAYNQWTQFEAFPRFMEGVEEVRQLDDRRLHWKAKVAGKEKEWDAEITEQVPDQRIAWHSVGGSHNAGAVTFHRIDDNTTKVMLQLEAEPESLVEKVGDAVGMLDRQVKKDLDHFREFIESRGRETGAWRGEVQRPGA
jgi:uncharacterized membrane protein